MKRLTIVGLGNGDPSSLSTEVIEAIRRYDHIVTRSLGFPTVRWLQSAAGCVVAGQHRWSGLTEGTDDRIDAAGTTAHEQAAVAVLLDTPSDTLYAVPGHPLLANRIVQVLLEQARRRDVDVRILGGASLLERVLEAAQPRGAVGVQTVDALATDDGLTQPGFPHPEVPLVLMNVCDVPSLKSAAAFLRRRYPSEHEALLVFFTEPVTWSEETRATQRVGGVSQEERDQVDWQAGDLIVRPIPIADIGMVDLRGGYAVVFVSPVPILAASTTLRALEYVTIRLRAPDGCPWDRAQTHDSIKRNLLEETYELLEALDEHDVAKCREELGDLLMQVFLHAQMGRESGEYGLDDVTRGIVEKLIRRHPHVFGDVAVRDVDEVLQNWDRIKREEGKHERSALAGIPPAMPALAYAQGVQDRAARAGFAWPDVRGAWAKFDEELAELRAAQSPEDVAVELGDVLFTLANLARYLDLQAEESLREASKRFRERFQQMEKRAQDRQIALREIALDELLELWQEAKRDLTARVGEHATALAFG